MCIRDRNNTSTGSPITGATNSTYTPPTFNTTGIYFYYCVVSLSGNGCDNYTSLIAEIEVVDIPIPLFTSLDSICVDEPPNFIISNSLWFNQVISATSLALLVFIKATCC